MVYEYDHKTNNLLPENFRMTPIHMLDLNITKYSDVLQSTKKPTNQVWESSWVFQNLTTFGFEGTDDSFDIR